MREFGSCVYVPLKCHGSARHVRLKGVVAPALNVATEFQRMFAVNIVHVVAELQVVADDNRRE